MRITFNDMVLILTFLITTKLFFILYFFLSFMNNLEFESNFNFKLFNLLLLNYRSYNNQTNIPTSTPSLEVNAIITYNPNKILMISRGHFPFGLALPGGHAVVGETVEHCLTRETKEETNLTISNYSLFGVYSEPYRDPREHVVALVYDVEVKDVSNLHPGDDANKVLWFDIKAILDLKEDIVFDHFKIITDYAKRKGLL